MELETKRIVKVTWIDQNVREGVSIAVFMKSLTKCLGYSRSDDTKRRQVS
jgi:hypothetical protein